MAFSVSTHPTNLNSMDIYTVKINDIELSPNRENYYMSPLNTS